MESVWGPEYDHDIAVARGRYGTKWISIKLGSIAVSSGECSMREAQGWITVPCFVSESGVQGRTVELLITKGT